jgi:hypothetical protein
MSHGYSVRSRLPDLHQRSAALEWFARGCSSLDSRIPVLHERMLRSLSRQAIGCASAALNESDRSVASEIVAFARHLWPEVTGTWEWRKYRLKLALGERAWKAIAPAHRALRSLATRPH